MSPLDPITILGVGVILGLGLLIQRWPVWVRGILALPFFGYFLWGAFTAQHLGSRITALVVVGIALVGLGVQAVREQRLK